MSWSVEFDSFVANENKEGRAAPDSARPRFVAFGLNLEFRVAATLGFSTNHS
jgi:hypothetical protein